MSTQPQMTARQKAKPERRELSVTEAARYYNRTTRTIRRWCIDGLLVRVGCVVTRDVTGRWRIIIPSTD